jgi:hypothetical protein
LSFVSGARDKALRHLTWQSKNALSPRYPAAFVIALSRPFWMQKANLCQFSIQLRTSLFLQFWAIHLSLGARVSG